MSRSKEAIRARFGSITPEFVDREMGAYLAQVSPETWDNYVKAGRIPASAPGFPDSTPRWYWPDVRRRLLHQAMPNHNPGIDRAALRAGFVADGSATKNARN